MRWQNAAVQVGEDFPVSVRPCAAVPAPNAPDTAPSALYRSRPEPV
jgi:hypothetical protein